MARTRASDFEEKQKSILSSAAAVIATQGTDKASMSQIAQHSNVSKALLYHYYPSKDALIFSIIEEHLLELDEALEQTDISGMAPREALRELAGTVLQCYRGADDAHRVQFNASTAMTQEQREQIRVIERRIVRRFAAVLRELNPDLERPGRPLLMLSTMTLFGMFNWAYMWFREDGPITREEYGDIVTTLFLEGVNAVR